MEKLRTGEGTLALQVKALAASLEDSQSTCHHAEQTPVGVSDSQSQKQNCPLDLDLLYVTLSNSKPNSISLVTFDDQLPLSH